MSMPYVVGQWVRRERFYGRGAQLDAVLCGPRDRLWVVGTRRIGKTSLLRQLEHLAMDDASLGRFPLFWDLQGVEDTAELALSFHDALLDAEGRLAAHGIEVGAAAGFPEAARRLVEALRPKGLSLLLLGDEAEDLAGLLGRDAVAAGDVVRTLTVGVGVRVVLASSVRFAALASRTPEGAELLRGLEAVYLGGLDPEDARALVRQDLLPGPDRPALEGSEVEAVCSHCGGHPFLLQLAAKRTLETGDAAIACAQVGVDPMVDYLFAADLALLDEGDCRIMRSLAAPSGTACADPGSELIGGSQARAAGVQCLDALGLLRRRDDGRLVPGNSFLAGWLARS
jgi:hypothetical protein